MAINNEVKDDKISVSDYLDDKELLELSYIPFDTKMQIVNQVLTNTIHAVGGLNTTLLRRVSAEVFIEAMTNIDMSKVDEAGLSGFDQLCYKNALDDLKTYLGREYVEFETMLSERANDYIRTETNPAVTINAIYDQIKVYFNTALNYISEQIQNADVEEISKNIMQFIPKDKLGGEDN